MATGGESMNPTPGASTLEVLEGANRYNCWIFDRVRQGLGRRVLEIGCGTGTITNFLLDRELVVGIDVVEDYVRSTARRYRDHPNVIILAHDLTESIEPLRGYGFDSALSVNVFEHIDDDAAATRAVYALLRPGGVFTLLVPSHPSLLGRFDRDIGHHRRYTKRGLRHRLESSGFLVESIRRSNPVGALGWLVGVRMLGKRRLQGVRLYDRLVPVLARLDAVELPIGLSLIARARKPVSAAPTAADVTLRPAA
jgi:SAM-dependent methyltransferase